MERNLFKYIWRHSWRDQAYILVIVVLLQVFYFISLDLPKRIVNDGIRGDSFKKADVDTLPFMHLSFGPYPNIGMPEITLFRGIPLDQQNYLFALCFVFLFFVVLNGWMKQWVNTAKGRLGERMLRRLRFELFDKVLRFPLSPFPQGEAGRNRHHDQGRGGAAGRLHRRCLHHRRPCSPAHASPRSISSSCRASGWAA